MKFYVNYCILFLCGIMFVCKFLLIGRKNGTYEHIYFLDTNFECLNAHTYIHNVYKIVNKVYFRKDRNKLFVSDDLRRIIY